MRFSFIVLPLLLLPAAAARAQGFTAREGTETGYGHLLAVGHRPHHYVAERLNEAFVVPHSAAVVSESCASDGFPWGVDAPWNAATRTLTFCDELQLDIALAFTGAGLEGDPHWMAVRYATRYILMHQAAHALIDLLDVAPGTDEEELAHRITGLLVVWDDGYGALYASEYWRLRDESAARQAEARGAPQPRPMAAHALDAARRERAMCWAYGHSQESHLRAGMGRTPDECRAEFRRLRAEVDALLAPHYRAGSPQ